MHTTFLVGLTQQQALRREMDVIANNLANMNTTGFKAEKVLFQEFLEAEDVAAGERADVSYVLDYGVTRDLTQGRIEMTGGPLDVALDGEGFFVVETGNGERYTRTGHFRMDDLGQLTTTAGDPVLDIDGLPILIDQGADTIEVANDGSISVDGVFLARLQAVTFETMAALKKEGDGLYSSQLPPEPAQNVKFLQGSVEQSNVVPIEQMSRMIEVMRSYQSATRNLKTAEDLASDAIKRLGKVA
jgi:flagellar basal-body rod protein FlgF